MRSVELNPAIFAACLGQFLAPKPLKSPVRGQTCTGRAGASKTAPRPGAYLAAFFAIASSFSERIMLRWRAASFRPSMPKATAISWE